MIFLGSVVDEGGRCNGGVREEICLTLGARSESYSISLAQIHAIFTLLCNIWGKESS
jgi:hypothetical protein